MSSSFVVEAQAREANGSAVARRLRAQGLVPAVLYGGGKVPQSFSVDYRHMQKHLKNEAFYSHIVTISLNGKSQQAILRALQRHPAKDQLLHVDFLRVQSDQAIEVRVPLHFIGADACVGVKQGGGVVNHIEADLLISCLPDQLPEYIEVDISELELGSSLHISDITLPVGVRSIDLTHGEEYDRAVVSVHVVREQPDEEIEEIAPEETDPA